MNTGDIDAEVESRGCGSGGHPGNRVRMMIIASSETRMIVDMKDLAKRVWSVCGGCNGQCRESEREREREFVCVWGQGQGKGIDQSEARM